MTALPALASPDPTLEALRTRVEHDGHTEPRPYLGMSSIGEPCERRLWYGFRWAVREEFTADTLWRFEDGHYTEALIAQRLRKVPGVELHTINPKTGQQIGFNYLGGHFAGHMDGIIRGLLQAPKTWHVWEAKASEKASELEKLRLSKGEKNALAEWNAVYYAQAVIYMASADLTRHYLTVATPGGRDIVSVRTDANPMLAKTLYNKAERIITASEPPAKISDNAAWYQCKYCPAHSICHGSKLPAVSCRTCMHATPELDGDGRWSCAHYQCDISTAEQRLSSQCPSHRYIPALVTYAKPIDADPVANTITYALPDGRTFLNGAHGKDSYSSDELRNMTPSLIGNSALDELRMVFTARLVENTEASNDAIPF